MSLQVRPVIINHPLPLFLRYWLWYTTKTYISGIAREVYKRLRMYQVNFIALQRKKDPEQVLLQCVPKHKVFAAMIVFVCVKR